MKKFILILCLLLIASPVFAGTFMANMTRHGQAITWNTQPGALAYPATENLTNATSSSGLPITYSTDTTTYCTVSGSVGSQVLNSVNAAGNCVVHANQAGNVHWFLASQLNSGNVAITGGCTASDSQTLTGDQSYAQGNWIADKWVAAATFTLTKMDLSGYYAGTGCGAGVITVEIRADSSGPGSILTNGTSTNSIAVSTMHYVTPVWMSVTPGALFDFGAGVTIASGTSYWIAVHSTEATCGAYINRSTNAGWGSNTHYYSSDGSGWTVQLDHTKMAYKAYNCTP